MKIDMPRTRRQIAPGLQVEQVWSADHLHDLVSHAPGTLRVEVMGTGLRSLGLLEGLPQLQTLYVRGLYHTACRPEFEDTISDFSALRRLPALRHLHVHECQYFDDAQLAHVTACSGLRALSLTSFMSSLSSHRGLDALPSLFVLEVNNVSDLTPIGTCGTLRRLRLTDEWARVPIRDFRPLESLRSLEELILKVRTPPKRTLLIRGRVLLEISPAGPDWFDEQVAADVCGSRRLEPGFHIP